MKLEEIIMKFAAAAGISNPVAVEGVWKFSADGHVFGVTADDSGNELWIYGEIPAPSPDREDAFRKAALEANFFMRGTGGAVLSINPESGAYTLMRSMPLETATPEDFFSVVEKFVNALATWKGISGATQEASEKLVPENPVGGSDGEAMANFPGMLRV